MNSHCEIAPGRASLAAEVGGGGDPVVLLHAANCDARMWRDQMEPLAADHMAVAYDRRGVGRTWAEAEDHSPITDLVAVLDAVAGGRPAVLVGCSQGGKVALDAALMHPSRIRGLVLVAPSVGGAPEVNHPPPIRDLLATQKAAEAAGDPERLAAVKARLWLDGPLAPENRVGGEARRLFLDMHAAAVRCPPVGASLDVSPTYGRLGEIGVPTLVTWGDLDFPHIQARCRHMVATMPGASGHELNGVADTPSLERPEAVSALVRDFLDGLQSR